MNNGFSYLSSCELTHQGNLRPSNEDAVLSLREYGLFCVADGMGGYEYGELASSYTVQALRKAFLSAPEPVAGYSGSSSRRLVEHALNQASDWIKNHAAAAGQRAAGTTTVVLLFDASNSSRAQILHAGDSRAYLFRSDKIVRLTRDHSIAEAIGLKDETSLPPMFRGIVTRAVGIESSVALEYTETDVRGGDIFLLCSDGLTCMLAEPDIEMLVRANQGGELANLAKTLVDNALFAGGLDNISVILVSVGNDLPNKVRPV